MDDLLIERPPRSGLFDALPPGERRPLWMFFDADWYARRHGCEDPLDFYLGRGARAGHSPNRLFDEAWYRARYVDVREAIERGQFASAFEHYCQGGHAARSPSAFFDETFYRRTQWRASPDDVAVNGLDHYLGAGWQAGCRPSSLFDPATARLFASGSEFADDQPLDPLQWMSDQVDAGGVLLRPSWYFDPGWYLETYPDVAAAIAAGLWSCPLAHYVGNATPLAYDPLPDFSENAYARAHADVAGAVASGLYRNGYAHFLERGIAERRRLGGTLDAADPDPLRSDLEVEGGLYPDRFAYRVARALARDGVSAPAPSPGEDEAKTLFARNARVTADAVLRTGGLDFARSGARSPKLTVVLVLHDQFDLTMTTLASLRAQGQAIELLLVDSGSSDDTRRIEQHVRGAKVIRFERNEGYVAGCNAAFLVATAPFILLLNNDVVLGPGALEAALRRIRAHAECGAVGGRIVRTHGRMQEAGCIIWRDARTTGYGRDRHADDPTVDFVREVDFCSGVFLLLRREAVVAVGGFDPVFAPCYYEDADLCFRLRANGFVTLYEPAATVTHYEYGSSDERWSSARIALAREIFARRHADRLRFQHSWHELDHIRARSSRRGQRRVLFIEDRIPHRRLGSGYVRANDLVREMSGLGYAVTIFPMHVHPVERGLGRADFPDDVELLADHSVETFAPFISARAGFYDLIWIGRTHNLTRLLPIFSGLVSALPPFGIISDTEAVASPRERARRRLAIPGFDPDLAGDDASEALRCELAPLGFAQRIVAVSAHDAALIREAGFASVDILGHALVARATPAPWKERRDLLFVGALHHDHSPNHDSLAWFVREVMPVLLTRRPDLSLTVAGFVGPDVATAFLDHPSIRAIGAQADLAPLYASHRVFIAPTRCAAGLPYKVHEAAAFGLPVVATSILAEQLRWQDEVELVVAKSTAPAAFADAVIRLDEDEDVWSTVRAGALARIAEDHTPSGFRSDLARVLDETLATAERSA